MFYLVIVSSETSQSSPHRPPKAFADLPLSWGSPEPGGWVQVKRPRCVPSWLLKFFTNPFESDRIPPAWCPSSQQNETEFSSEAKEIFLL